MADLNFAAVHQTAGRISEPGRHIGAFVDVDSADVESVINGYATARDLWTPTVSGAITSVRYQAPNESTYTDYTVSVSTAAGLAEALGDLGTALGRAITQWYTVDQTTAACTAKNPGVSGTLTGTTNLSWANTTPAASGTDIPVGRLVIRAGTGTAPGAVGKPKGRIPAASTTQKPTSKQVITWTISGTLNTGDDLVTTVRNPYLGIETQPVITRYATSQTATLAAHATAVNTALDLGITAGGLGSGFGAGATSDATTFVLTADVKGYAFDANTFVSNTAAGTALATKAYTTGSVGDAITDVVPNVIGLLGRGGQVEHDSSDVPVLKPLKVGTVARRGGVVVANTQSPSADDPVWLDPATGLLYNAGASGYIPLPKALARWDHSAGSSGYEVVWLRRSG